MMNVIIDLIMISIIICFIINISGIVDNVKELIFKLIYPNRKYVEYSLKPFDCSLCMIWWIGLIYLLIVGKFTLFGIMVVALFSMLNQVITSILILIEDICVSVIQKITKYL